MKEENLNKEKINKQREKEEKKMKEEGAKRVREHGEKGYFTGKSHLEVTPEQIEKARKEMLEELEPVKAKLEEISEKIKELEKKYKESNVKRGIEGSKEDIENKIKKEEEKLREIEEVKDSPQSEKEKVLKEIEERFGEEKEELEKENNKLKTQLEIAKERADKLVEKEEKEKLDKKLSKVAQKIVNNEVINQEELDLQRNHPEKLREKMKQLWREKEQTESKETSKSEVESEKKKVENEENEEESKEESKKEDFEEETLDLEKELPDDLVELLEKSTLNEENKSLFKKAAIKFRNITGEIGSAIGLKHLASKVPGVSKFLSMGVLGAGAGGAIAGVGFKLGRYGIEAWEEKKSYEKFKENLKDIDSGEEIKEKMANAETNISILSEKIDELSDENDKLKEEGVWFFQKERREKRREIKEHKKTLEKIQDEFRYLSVEAKKEFGNANVETLAESLIDEKRKQLEAIINSGGPHGELVQNLLANTENKSDLTEKIKNADTGLKAKLDQQDRNVPLEILEYAVTFGALGAASEYILQIPAVQNQLDKISDWFSQIDINMPDLFEGGEEVNLDKLSPEQAEELRGLIAGLEEESGEATLELVDKVAELQTDYSVEMGDNVWSVTEEFLNDNLGESFQSLGEAEQTYVIDYITTAIENNPESFNLDLAEGESINHLLANSEHSINFEPLLRNGELQVAIEKAGNLSTEDIANILENNEALRELISENPDLKLTPENIQEALESGEISEEALSSLSQETSPLASAGEGITEIPYSEGELTMNLQENEISFALDGKTFAEGTINKQGDYYIAIDNNKQIDLDYTKAYNSARIHLNELLDGDAEVVIEGLQSESISSGEQIANMENWLERMHSGGLNEAHFDFMVGNQKEEWIQQLAEIENVSPEQMEELITESYQEITGDSAEAIGENMTMNELVDQMTHPEMDPFLNELEGILKINAEKPADVADAILNQEITINEYVDALEEVGIETNERYLENLGVNVQEYNLQEAEVLKSEIRRDTTELIRNDIDAFSELETSQTAAESTVESGVYTQEGSLDVMDQMEFFENFSESFGVEADVTSDIVDAIASGEVTPEEFVSWLESGNAFGKEIVFDGAENPPREVIKRELDILIKDFNEAASKEGRRKVLELKGARKSGRSIIQSIMSYGK